MTPNIEVVEVSIKADELIKLLSPTNKSGVMFYTKDNKKVFIECSGKRPIIVK